MIKIITGLRKSGKSYLLNPIFKNSLLEDGVTEDHIIKVDLDSIENRELTTDGLNLYKYIMEQEQKSLVNIDDSFKKIIIVKDDINLWRNEEGILIISLEAFLLNPNSLGL